MNRKRTVIGLIQNIFDNTTLNQTSINAKYIYVCVHTYMHTRHEEEKIKLFFSFKVLPFQMTLNQNDRCSLL